MVEAAKASGLSKQEMPSNVYVETLQWLPETGLVTDAFKIKRKVKFQKSKFQNFSILILGGE